jgi:protocatechuate 3,4-dioxygenase, alpha subunit
MQNKQTPSQTVGPFFSYGLLDKGGENILVNDSTRGQRILIMGQIVDGDGNPMPDGMLEIWQADANGCFNHPADPNQSKADKNFRGFGRSGTVNEGKFQFKTIKPGAVAFDETRKQAPHINVRLFARGMLIHAYTRLYFSDEQAANEQDPVLNLVPADRQHTLVAYRQDSDDLPTYCFNITLQGENETVFFDP